MSDVMHPESSVVPRDKFDLAAANAAAEAGWPTIEPQVEQLLLWIQDANWPVARILAPALAVVGAPLAPYVRHILVGEDETWKYHVIGAVVAQSPELVFALRPVLGRIANLPTPSERAEGVCQIARAALENS